MTEPVYDQQDADNYHLATENRNLRKALEELQQQIAALRAENERLFKELAYHVDQRQQLEAMNKTAEAQLTALQAENEKLQQRNDNQYAIISDFSSQLRALQEKL